MNQSANGKPAIPASASRTYKSLLIFPTHTNNLNTVFGGKVMVALDEKGRPTPVPPVIPETEEEQELSRGAAERYRMRKKLRNKRNER